MALLKNVKHCSKFDASTKAIGVPADKINVKKKVCLFTEWAWTNRLFDNPHKLSAFAHVIYEKIEAKYPSTNGNRNLAIKEIENDIFDCLKKLNYGGRKPSSQSKERLNFLTQVSQSFFL